MLGLAACHARRGDLPTPSLPSLPPLELTIIPHPTHLPHTAQGSIESRGMTVGKYLIIGGTGGIGRMLANRLVMKYHKVREVGV